MDHMSGKLIAECSVASEFRLDTNSVRDVAKKKKKERIKGSWELSDINGVCDQCVLCAASPE